MNNDAKLAQELMIIIHNLVNTIEKEQTYTLFIYLKDQSLEFTESLIEQTVMSLLLEYEADIPDNVNISLLPQLTEYQWQFLTKKINQTIQF